MDESNEIDQLRAKFTLLREAKMSLEEEFSFRKEAVRFPELSKAIREFDELGESLLLSSAQPAPSHLKNAFMEELRHEKWKEQASTQFPVLNTATQAADLKDFVSEAQVHRDLGQKNFHMEVLETIEGLETMLVHVKLGLPSEVHSDLIEQFLLLKGECKVQLGDETLFFKPGAFLRVPLLVHHSIEVTSKEPCVFICQRISA